jgi:PAS domain S-box-containing protein
MDQLHGSEALVELVRACTAATDVATLYDTVLPKVRRLLGAETIAVEVAGPEGPVHAYVDGLEVPPHGVPVSDGGSHGVVLVPDPWHALGVDHLVTQRLAGHAGILALGWPSLEEATPVAAQLPVVLDLVALAVSRLVVESELHDLATRVDSAQHLASMGDYDWHIASDTNQWSDELYRIYGYEPQSFNPSYERFLANIHPDDRERIQGIHQQAYATGEPYRMIERIVRPDGDVRYLSSNGVVIMDAAGTPVRMRGTCIDITERVLAEHEREQVTERFQRLVEAAPEAILVIDAEEAVVQANQRAAEVLGSDPTGRRLRDFLPQGAETGRSVRALGDAGQALVLDVASVAFKESERGDMTAVFLADAGPRLDREALATRLGEAQQRRRQALEINDNVVQGLTAASYALDQDDFIATRSYLNRTLLSARHMMDDLLEPQSGEEIRPGDLIRAEAASLEPQVTLATEPAVETVVEAAPRILIVDDAEDIRMLLRLKLAHRGEYDVVGEAEDGVQAVDQARALQPDLVLLDMAMPRMDGLQALPMIREAVPGVRVIVLSGFNQATLEKEALAAGADRYVVKGGSMQELLDLISDVLRAA